MVAAALDGAPMLENHFMGTEPRTASHMKLGVNSRTTHAPATKLMALSQRLSAISMSGAVLQENATRNHAIPNGYGR